MTEKLTTANEIKVFILYLLEKIGYPLTFNELASIVIQDDFVDYFDFATYFHELLETGQIIRNEPAEDGGAGETFELSETGKMVSRGMSSDVLSRQAKEKSYISAQRHLSLEKRDASMSNEIESVGADKYRFHCQITDKDGLVFKLSLRADSYEQVQKMRKAFEDRPDVISRGLISLTSGDVEYLITKR